MSYIMAETDSPFDIFYLWLQRKKERKKERKKAGQASVHGVISVHWFVHVVPCADIKLNAMYFMSAKAL